MYFKQNPQDFSKARDLGGNKLDIISGLQKIRKGKKKNSETAKDMQFY